MDFPGIKLTWVIKAIVTNPKVSNELGKLSLLLTVIIKERYNCTSPFPGIVKHLIVFFQSFISKFQWGK